MDPQVEGMLKQIIAGQEQMARELAGVKRAITKLKRMKGKKEELPELTPAEVQENVAAMMNTVIDLLDKKDDIEIIKKVALSEKAKQEIAFADPDEMLKPFSTKLRYKAIKKLKNFLYTQDKRGVDLTQGETIEKGLELFYASTGVVIIPRPESMLAAERVVVGNMMLGKARKLSERLAGMDSDSSGPKN